MKSIFFVRLGPGSGQWQTHKTLKEAPAKKGVWLLPMFVKKGELWWLGNKNWKTKQERTIDEYRKFSLKREIFIWAHVKPKANKIAQYFIKETEYGECHWYKISVNDYIPLAKAYIKSCLPYGYDGEVLEVFYETT